MPGGVDVRLRRRRDERGSVLVESAFIFPVVVLMTVAVIEFGLMFATQSTTTSASRDGARFASANFAPASNKQTAADSIRDAVLEDLDALTDLGTPEDLWIYRADPGSTKGEPVGGAGFASCNTDCFRYTWNGTTFVHAGGTWTTPQACSTLDVIGVNVKVEHNLITGFFADTTDIREHTALQLEPLPFENCSSP